MPYKAWAGLLQCWRRGGNGFMLLSVLRQRSQATEEVELKLQTLRSLALSGRNHWREKAAGEIKKKKNKPLDHGKIRWANAFVQLAVYSYNVRAWFCARKALLKS